MEKNLFLPDVLIREILLRLPVRSVLRFKCVCKSWLSLILDSQFAKSHFDLASTSTHQRLFKVVEYGKVSSINIEASIHGDLEETRFNIPPPSLPIYNIAIVGSCRGFILLRLNPRNMFFSGFLIWNPSTGCQKRINLMRRHGGIHEYVTGIGYDSSTDDYAVVVIRGSSDPHQRVVVEYFSLRTNSWSASKNTLPSYHHASLSKQAQCLNGVLYWLENFYNPVVIAFDLKEKRLSEIATVPTAYNSKYKRIRVMGDCLCFWFVNIETKMFELWTMGEYKVQSWTKLFVLSTTEIGVFYPICFTGNGEIMGTNLEGNLLARFNDKGELLEHRAHGKNKIDLAYYFVLHKESLLSLPQETSEDDEQP